MTYHRDDETARILHDRGDDCSSYCGAPARAQRAAALEAQLARDAVRHLNRWPDIMPKVNRLSAIRRQQTAADAYRRAREMLIPPDSKDTLP